MLSNKVKVGLAVLAAVLVVAACDYSAPPQVVTQVAPAPMVAAPSVAPVIVQQPSNDGFFTGMLMGHLMSGGGGGVQRNTTVINKSYTTVTRPTYAARPAPSYSRSYSSPSYSRSSSFGSFRSGRR